MYSCFSCELLPPTQVNLRSLRVGMLHRNVPTKLR